MKKAILYGFAAMTVLSSCTKDKKTTSPTPAPSAKDGFVWKEDGGVEITADSAFWASWSTGTGVRAYKNGMANFFEINWDGAVNTSVGSKNLDAGKGLTFLKGTETYVNAGAEKMNITAFSSDKLSGNFEVTLSGGTIKKVAGTFTNIPKK